MPHSKDRAHPRAAGPGRFQPVLGVSGRPPRPERIAEQLRQEISSLMVTEMKDPRVRLASVSRVRISPDLRTATVMISAVGDEPERHGVVDAMRHAEGYLRAQLGHRLENLKSPPHLIFELDESIAYSVRISSVLRELESRQEPDPDGAEDQEPAPDGVEDQGHGPGGGGGDRR
jgi:ribosome-binding factor A